MTEKEVLHRFGGVREIAEILNISLAGAYKKFDKKTFTINDVVRLAAATNTQETVVYSMLRNMEVGR